jgi:hypothetical protein
MNATAIEVNVNLEAEAVVISFGDENRFGLPVDQAVTLAQLLTEASERILAERPKRGVD